MAGSELEDLALLEAKVVNEAAVVELIRRRYSHNKIYTAVGDILLSVNRFKSLPIYMGLRQDTSLHVGEITSSSSREGRQEFSHFPLSSLWDGCRSITGIQPYF